jgi:hypothetical protein
LPYCVYTLNTRFCTPYMSNLLYFLIQDLRFRLVRQTLSCVLALININPFNQILIQFIWKTRLYDWYLMILIDRFLRDFMSIILGCYLKVWISAMACDVWWQNMIITCTFIIRTVLVTQCYGQPVQICRLGADHALRKNIAFLLSHSWFYLQEDILYKIEYNSNKIIKLLVYSVKYVWYLPSSEFQIYFEGLSNPQRNLWLEVREKSMRHVLL